jgi:hypothetical protein
MAHLQLREMILVDLALPLMILLEVELDASVSFFLSFFLFFFLFFFCRQGLAKSTFVHRQTLSFFMGKTFKNMNFSVRGTSL